jgi:hypothetical protein
MKQRAFFISPSRLSWKIISCLSDHIFNANHLLFTGVGISTLELHGCGPLQHSTAAPHKGIVFLDWVLGCDCIDVVVVVGCRDVGWQEGEVGGHMQETMLRRRGILW